MSQLSLLVKLFHTEGQHAETMKDLMLLSKLNCEQHSNGFHSSNNHLGSKNCGIDLTVGRVAGAISERVSILHVKGLQHLKRGAVQLNCDFSESWHPHLKHSTLMLPADVSR